MPRDATLEALRATVRRIERGGRDPAPVRPLGVAAVDDALPWKGMPLACLHHVVAGPAAFDGAATAFVALLAARLSEGRGPVLWCVEAGRDDTLHGPGLAALGLPPGQALVIRGRGPTQVLWCMEEGLRCPALGAVVGQVARLDPASARRLRLAAEAGGGAGLILGRLRHDIPASATTGDAPPETGGLPGGAATTRWRVETLPSRPAPWGGPGPARWRAHLERCRGGFPQSWTLEWNDETGDLSVAADLPDGPPDADGSQSRRVA